MCYANRDNNYGFYYPNQEAVARKNGINVSLATYYEVEKPCRAIANLKYDPLILSVASKYLGGKPVHQGTKLWWSFPANLTTYEAYVNAQCYHYDLDDYSACKFFFYFTDVHIHDGPHMCVIKTHKRKSFLHKVIRGYYSDRQVQDYYGMENVETIYGPPGFGFVEDAFCLHKGQLPVQNDRLILSIEFALRDYGLQHEVQREASDDFVKPIWARHSRRPKASSSPFRKFMLSRWSYAKSVAPTNIGHFTRMETQKTCHGLTKRCTRL
jgi:hypothetical protein